MGNDLGKILKQRRLMIPLTLRELSGKSNISESHLGRIERGERFPSAHVLKKISPHLGFDETELFALAGYLSSQPSTDSSSVGQLDPYVTMVLSREPMKVQRAVILILMVLKSIEH